MSRHCYRARTPSDLAVKIRKSPRGTPYYTFMMVWQLRDGDHPLRCYAAVRQDVLLQLLRPWDGTPDPDLEAYATEVMAGLSERPTWMEVHTLALHGQAQRLIFDVDFKRNYHPTLSADLRAESPCPDATQFNSQLKLLLAWATFHYPDEWSACWGHKLDEEIEHMVRHGACAIDQVDAVFKYSAHVGTAAVSRDAQTLVRVVEGLRQDWGLECLDTSPFLTCRSLRVAWACFGDAHRTRLRPYDADALSVEEMLFHLHPPATY